VNQNTIKLGVGMGKGRPFSLLEFAVQGKTVELQETSKNELFGTKLVLDRDI